MDLKDIRFVTDLQEALRCGMVEALGQHQKLTKLGASGVERTLYAKIREKAVEYLNSLGYSYLTSDPAFFVIGEVTVPGTNKRADGLICDPTSGNPVYALEVGMAGAGKFHEDFEKTLEEWTRTGLNGVFILLLDTEGGNDKIYSLDGAVLRTPRKESFVIYPLILPTKPSLGAALLSTTCARYWDRRSGQTVRVLAFSDRDRGEVIKWTTDLIQPVAEAEQKMCVTEIFDPSKKSDTEAFKLFSDFRPQIIIAQGVQSPLKLLGSRSKARFEQYRKQENPLLVFMGDWLERKYWEGDTLTNSLLPVTILGENQKDGKWDCPQPLPKFGKQIRPTKKPFLDLSELTAVDCSIKGFVKVKTRPNVSVDLEIEADGIYPLIVSNFAERVIWFSTGIGGWGSEWYNKYAESYQMVWREILTKMKVFSATI